MNRPQKIAMALHLAADFVIAGLLIFVVCLVAFMISRELTPNGMVTWDGDIAAVPMNIRSKVSRNFSSAPVLKEKSYASPSMAVSLSTFSTNIDNRYDLVYHVADICVSDVRSIRTAFAKDTYGVGIIEPMLDMVERHGGLVALNGDYYCYQNGGLVVRNGKLYRNEPCETEACALLANGEMWIVQPGLGAKALANMNVWQAWTFGPSLLDADGHAKQHFATRKYLAFRNPRSAIGYFTPGHYCFVVCDGRDRGYSDGASLKDLAAIMEGLGCKLAYNLDGGSSSILTFNGRIFNRPSSGGRDVGDCIVVGEVRQ